ncbi:U3 small nucleolar RNA-associated protein 6-like [Quillaja saponaria]|uniref:U3 small nucleolar RNA-associated protein 6-like n=1 Tax=Quillaja saponaria TaxID=32244 RepID=A0AAD7KV22_QUISA|nr:U3 small nucleolar RNA-associated protein 6-like [Quillaja saponaria]
MKRPETMGCVAEDLASQHISFYLQIGQLDEARKLAEKFTEKLTESVELWILRISIEMKCITRNSPFPSKADLLNIFELLKVKLTKVPVSKSQSLWLMALKFFANHRDYFDKLVEISIASLAKDCGSETECSLSSAVVNFVLQKDGIQNARKIYMRFLDLPHPGLALYESCINLELNMASIGDKDGLVNARKLYESALATYSQNIKLWRDYYLMETKMGVSEKATAISWRARKTLNQDIIAFVTSQEVS